MLRSKWRKIVYSMFFFRSTALQISGLNERTGGKSGIKWKMQPTQSRSPCLRWHGWALTSLDWHLSLQMTWNCPYQCNWHTIDLYLCRRGLKFIVSCNEERRLSLMLIFEKFWWLGAKLQGGGGGCNSQGNSSKSDSLCLWGYWVGPSIWPSFIQIGEIACVTPACSHGHSLEVWQKRVFFLFWATVIDNLGKRFNS